MSMGVAMRFIIWLPINFNSPYRATSISMPGAMDGNPVARDVLASLKSAIDPQNLVAPGRYGMPLRGTAPR